MPRPTLSFRKAAFATGAAVQLMAACHVFTHYFYRLSSTEGPSMLPTLNIMGQGVLVASCARAGTEIFVGDLVTYKVPVADYSGLKRVVGMPGDYVAVKPREVGGDDMMQVPQGHCWVVGDNLSVSRDSRDYGPVPIGLVTGKVLATLWPFEWIENGMNKVTREEREQGGKGEVTDI